MSSQEPLFSEPPFEPAPARAGERDGAGERAGARDWAQPLIDRQLAVLSDLTEIALAVSQALGREIVGAAEPSAPSRDMTALRLAFDRAARAVRLAVALQARLIADRQAWEVETAARLRRLAPSAYERGEEAENCKDRVERILRRVAEAQPQDGEAADPQVREDAVERLLDEARERLDEDDIYDVLDHPISDTIAYICRELGLAPDWPRLAEEAWARAEIESGQVGAPLAALKTAGTWEKPQPKPPKPPDRWPEAASPAGP